MARRLLLPVLTALMLAGAVLPAAAGHRCQCRRHPRVTVSTEDAGSLIIITYHRGISPQVRFLRSDAAIERVALTDVDNDGDLDILAAPHDGRLRLWRNAGHGRFAAAALPRDRHGLVPRGPRFARVGQADDGWQWGVERYDAAMPRAPAVAAAVPIDLVRVSSFVPVRPVSIRRSSGRAPPLA